ncbi:MAG TPA: DUF3467 domain-containing protein [Anaerolineae bacterium]|nr:DUF3467 domain-containing protein [Anaerolineae bacterium]
MTQAQPGQPMQINIEVPADLDPVYSNFAMITHSPSEVIVDFARILPNTPKSKVHARILMTPLHAKLLHNALADSLRKYEAQFGEIKVPAGGTDLAQQFFRQARPPEE